MTQQIIYTLHFFAALSIILHVHTSHENAHECYLSSFPHPREANVHLFTCKATYRIRFAVYHSDGTFEKAVLDGSIGASVPIGRIWPH